MAKRNYRRDTGVLVVAFALLFVPMPDAPWLHGACALVAALATVWHVRRYGKWLRGSARAFRQGKLAGRTRVQFLLAIAILGLGTFAMLNGCGALMALTVTGDVPLMLHRLHHGASMLCGVLALAHGGLAWTRRQGVKGQRPGSPAVPARPYGFRSASLPQ